MGKKKSGSAGGSGSNKRRREEADVACAEGFHFTSGVYKVGEKHASTADGGDDGELSFDPEDVEPMALEPELKELEPMRKAGHEASAAGDGTKMMRWMLAPLPLETFMTECFERRPVFISRSEKAEDYYDGWFSREEMDRMMRECELDYTYNVDVTSYTVGGTRRTMNSNDDGTTDKVWNFGVRWHLLLTAYTFEASSSCTSLVDAASVWKKYKEGCSVRMLHPQRFSEPLWGMLSALESFWTSAVGCNTYLTPENSQGFAPHWDDIDAFVLQVVGSSSVKTTVSHAKVEVRHVCNACAGGRKEALEGVCSKRAVGGTATCFQRGLHRGRSWRAGSGSGALQGRPPVHAKGVHPSSMQLSRTCMSLSTQ
eukprot:6023103-Pyramimonas_sp.AAC.2